VLKRQVDGGAAKALTATDRVRIVFRSTRSIVTAEGADMNSLNTITLIVAASIAAFATLSQAQENEAPVLPQLTRAEVIADMQIWSESGAAANLKHRDDARHSDFVAALAKYEQMRAAPEFAKRVAAIAQQRGERVQTAASK
jgi:hypothetical protein